MNSTVKRTLYCSELVEIDKSVTIRFVRHRSKPTNNLMICVHQLL